MSDVTSDDLKAAIPQITSKIPADAARLAELTDEAYELVGQLGRSAVLNCLAHLIELEGESGLDGGSGVVKSERLGPKQTTYALQAERGADSWYETTVYGRRVLRLKASSGVGVFGMIG